MQKTQFSKWHLWRSFVEWIIKESLWFNKQWSHPNVASVARVKKFVNRSTRLNEGIITVTVFGYLILVSIKFMIILLHHFFSFVQVLIETIQYIKHKRHRSFTFQNTLKFYKITKPCIVYSTLFSMFGDVLKHGPSCLI